MHNGKKFLRTVGDAELPEKSFDALYNEAAVLRCPGEGTELRLFGHISDDPGCHKAKSTL